MNQPIVESRVDVIVRSTEIDINGHVNNAKYVEYMEWGREDFYDKAHLPYDVLFEEGLITVTVNVNVNYRAEARQNDVLTVITRPGMIGRSSFTMGQTVIRETDDTLIADATVTLVTIDAETRKSREIPEILRKFFT